MSSLTPEEKAILASVERGEWQSVANVAEEIKRYQNYAQLQMDALKVVSIHLSTQDLKVLQELAQQADTEVSALMSFVLHEYVVSHASSES